MKNENFNIASALIDNADRFPDKKAIIYPAGLNKNGSVRYEHKTFKQLDVESDQFAAGFLSAGISKGVKTIFLVKPGPELFSITFGLFKIGAIPVIVDPGLGVKRMLQCYNAVGAEAFIGIKRAHIFRLLFANQFKSVKTWITAGRRLFWGGYSLDELKKCAANQAPLAETSADELALINFTTGSTGPAKGVEYTPRMIIEEYRSLKANFFSNENNVDLATLSLFALYDILIGITAVLPKIDSTKPAKVNPLNIIDPINDFKITTMFASPALLNTVAKFGIERNIKLPTLKTVLSGGAPVTTSVMQSFHKLLSQDASIVTTYGATEALPISAIDSDTLINECRSKTAVGMGTCIGKPLDNVEVSIIKISDAPIHQWDNSLLVNQGEVGEIVIKGDIVSKNYHKNPRANSLSKIKDGDGIRHRMGDLGSVDSLGRIWFCGRKQHRVCTEDEIIFSVQVEGIFNSHPDVYRSALIGIGPEGNQTPMVCIELDPARAGLFNDIAKRKELASDLMRLARANAVTQKIARILFHEAFPVDIRHNAKIFREQLTDWAQTQISKESQNGF